MAAVISGICFGSIIGALMGLKVAEAVSNENKKAIILGAAVGAVYGAIGGGFLGTTFS